MALAFTTQGCKVKNCGGFRFLGLCKGTNDWQTQR